jgi:hypothetical protein
LVFFAAHGGNLGSESLACIFGKPPNEMKPCQSFKKPKHPKKKGEYKEQNGRTHIQENKRTT